MERDGTVLSRDESGDETEEDIEILKEDRNGNNNGHHKERYSSLFQTCLNAVFCLQNIIRWKCSDHKKSLDEDD